jgi:hypothetical protein
VRDIENSYLQLESSDESAINDCGRCIPGI